MWSGAKRDRLHWGAGWDPTQLCSRVSPSSLTHKHNTRLSCFIIPTGHINSHTHTPALASVLLHIPTSPLPTAPVKLLPRIEYTLYHLWHMTHSHPYNITPWAPHPLLEWVTVCDTNNPWPGFCSACSERKTKWEDLNLSFRTRRSMTI